MESDHNVYQCTRNKSYDDPGCKGYMSIKPRHRYQVIAKTPFGAIINMLAAFPSDMMHGFTVELHKGWRDGYPMLWTWSLSEGVRDSHYIYHGSRLRDMMISAKAHLKDPDAGRIIYHLDAAARASATDLEPS